MNPEYPKPYIHETALAILLGGTENRRYSWVKRALKKGTLVRLKRGVYLIEKKDAETVDAFEIALQLNGPSYISFESALAHHGWIPEAVYTITSATPKRSSIVPTPIGTFSFEHTLCKWQSITVNLKLQIF
jgi:predicted transcriptional regulator of viral defense system